MNQYYPDPVDCTRRILAYMPVYLVGSCIFFFTSVIIKKRIESGLF